MKRTLYYREVDPLTVALLFEPRDLWLGVFWDLKSGKGGYTTCIYLCLLPCLPLRFSWWTKDPDPAVLLARFAGVGEAEARADPNRTYRRAIRKIRHPDQGGDPALFRKVTEAYEALK